MNGETLPVQASVPQSVIPHQLRDCRFILVEKGGKRALEPSWQRDHNYPYDHPKLLDHIARGGNYGVLLRGDVSVIDADRLLPLIELDVLSPLMETFSVRTGREENGMHLYFRCPDAPADKVLLYHPDTGEELGDLRGPGSKFYVVGPNCTHPSGRQYQITKNLPLAEFTWEEITEQILKKVALKKKRAVRTQYNAQTLTQELGLRCEDFLMPIHPEYLGSDIRGGHPVHGSTTGRPIEECNNLSIDTTQNVWHCFACGSGGDALMAYAVARGIIDCAEAVPGAVQQHWNEIITALEEEGLKPRGRQAAKHTYQKDNSENFEIICNNRGLEELGEDARLALEMHNDPPTIFVRSGELVCIASDENGTPVIERMTEAAVRGRMARSAKYVRYKNTKERPVKIKVPPPVEAVRDVMASSQDWIFPALKNIVETPVLKQDGNIVSTPGFDKSIGVYYAPAEGFSFEPPNENPSLEEVQLARKLLEEVFTDFPFADKASLANAIAAMITPLVRPLITGPVPMAILDKPQAGTGASLLAEVIALVATGRPAAMLQAPKNLEEWRKKITSLLIEGRSVIVVDNLEGRLYAGPLAAALTATIWQDRRMGSNEMISLPNAAIWIANGNNVQLGGDLPRRCYWVRLDAKMPRPWQRNGFVHPDLKIWVSENRGRIVSAILTIARAWINSGKPVPDSLPPLGGFESWQNVIGGIMYRGGWVDFLGNQEQMYAESDTDTPQWESFLQAWYNIWQDNPVTSSTIATRLDSDNGADLVDNLPDQLAEAHEKPRSSFVRILGKALSAKKQVRFASGYYLERVGVEHKVTSWRVICPTE